MTLSEVVSIIAHDYDKSFDHAFREKIALEVISKRALLIRRDLEKGRQIDPGLVNVISDVEVAVTPEFDCWFRTLCPIPKPIRLSEGNTIFSVGSDIFNTYDMIEPMEVGFLEYSKWGKNCSRGKAFYLNGHIYTDQDNPLTIQMVAGDPTKFQEFIEGCGNGTSACDFEPDAFITDDMVDPIKRLIGETFPRVESRDYQIRPDEQI